MEGHLRSEPETRPRRRARIAARAGPHLPAEARPARGPSAQRDLSASAHLLDGEFTGDVARTSLFLAELADTGAGYAFDEGPALRQLPAPDPAGQVFTQGCDIRVHAVAGYGAGERPGPRS